MEDYFIIAELYRSYLEDSGYEVMGPVPTVAAAMKILEAEVPDAAVLDLSLGATLVTPVAERLRAMRCPFVFLTALADLDVLPEEFRTCTVVEKPADRATLIAALEVELNR